MDAVAIMMARFVVDFHPDASGLDPDLPYKSLVSIENVHSSCWTTIMR
jgi:hypothetical protein